MHFSGFSLQFKFSWHCKRTTNANIRGTVEQQNSMPKSNLYESCSIEKIIFPVPYMPGKVIFLLHCTTTKVIFLASYIT